MPLNPLPLRKIHHVELLVGNAKQAAFFYRRAFGFSQLAYAGPETGVGEQASYVLQQGDIRVPTRTDTRWTRAHRTTGRRGASLSRKS